MSDSVRPQRWQPTRLRHPWDSPGKNTGVGCHFLLQCRKVKSEREAAQSCPTLCNPMDCSPPGSSIHGIFQARVPKWGASHWLMETFLDSYLLNHLQFSFAFFFFCFFGPCCRAFRILVSQLGVKPKTPKVES